MMYDSIEIEGFRGFGSSQKVTFAMPNGTDRGSGLTIIVGENNSGKSTVIEALRSFTMASSTFSEGQRNERHGDRVRVVLRSSSGDLIIATHPNWGCANHF
jgi:AAA15 family ATPase/GTPase